MVRPFIGAAPRLTGWIALAWEEGRYPRGNSLCAFKAYLRCDFTGVTLLRKRQHVKILSGFQTQGLSGHLLS